MPSAVAHRALCIVAIAAGVVRAQPERRPVAVIDLSETDDAKALRRDLEDALYQHWALKPPANRFDQELQGTFLDEDKTALKQAREQLKFADDALARNDSKNAITTATTGLEGLTRVAPTTANWLRADLEFAIGIAELIAHDKKAAAVAFAFAAQLDPTRKLDPARYLDEIVRAFDAAKTAPAPKVALEVTGVGHVWIDGVSLGNAPHTFEIPAGKHLVQIADFDHETRGEIVDAPGKIEIDAPLATPELKVQRARAALARAPDQTALAGSLRQLADVIGVRDAVLIAKKDGKLFVSTVTWKGDSPVFSREREPAGATPDVLLEPLSGPKPIDEPKDPPRPPIKPRVDPDPHHENEPAWYRKRWVQVSIVGGVIATVATILIATHHDQTVPLDTKTRFPLP